MSGGQRVVLGLCLLAALFFASRAAVNWHAGNEAESDGVADLTCAMQLERGLAPVDC